MKMGKTDTQKRVIDAVMSLLMLFLMGYQFFGELLHEWFGVAIFVLFAIHHILNRSWIKNIAKGKYNPIRFLFTLTDFLLIISMIMEVYSSMVISRYVFVFLNIQSGMALARKLHILGAYWGYVLMAFHLGLHWSMLVKALDTKFKISSKSVIICRKILGLGIAGYGVYALLKRGVIDNMLLVNEFIFLDYMESPILYYLDYVAIAGLFVWLGNICIKRLKLLATHSAK